MLAKADIIILGLHAEIADHLGVHYATVSRRLKQAEQTDV